MSTILEQWNEITTLVETLEGNASAGVRARRGLRLLKTKSAEHVKTTISFEKERKQD